VASLMIGFVGGVFVGAAATVFTMFLARAWWD
jgi:hypothetical protein